MSDNITSKLLKTCFLQAIIVLLAGLNVYLSCTSITITPTLGVRWREFISLLVVTPISVVLFFIIHNILEQHKCGSIKPLLLLILGSCWLSLSMGIHEPINAFRIQYSCDSTALAKILWFWDDIFSHALFFTGYVTISLALLWSQKRNPLTIAVSRVQTILFVVFGMIGGVGIAYSLAPGKMTVDVAVIAVVLIGSEVLRKGRSFRKMPLNIVMEVGYLIPLMVFVIKSIKELI